MNLRDRIRMTDEEIQQFLQAERTIQVATIGRDGYPHLVAMWYTYLDGNLAFWTYVRSQKIINLRRDPRITILAETGSSYEELRGVQIKGEGTILDAPQTVLNIGRLLQKRYANPQSDYVDSPEFLAQAAKRVIVVVKPHEIVSWDHSKLSGLSQQQK